MFLILHCYKKYGLEKGPWQSHVSSYPDRFEEFVQDYKDKTVAYESYESFQILQYSLEDLKIPLLNKEFSWKRPEKKVRVLNPDPV